MPPTLQPLIEWLESLDLRNEPEVQERARLLLLDTLACIAAGLTKPEPAALAVRLASVTPGNTSWPGHPAALGSADAAYIGALAACWDEACEGLARAHGRPGLHAVPVIAALGGDPGHSLGEVLTAIVKAYEIGGRFGASMRVRDGMHVDGTWGLFASTAAACAIQGASQQETCNALASAACQMPASLYLPVRDGCTARNTYGAHAAATGIQLTASAMAGITAPDTAFDECDRVLLAGEATDWSSFDDQSHYYLLDGYLKPFAAVRHVHYAAACAIQWHDAHTGRADAIKSVSLETYPEAVTYCGNRAPTTAIQAQFSLSYGTAHALRTGTLGPEAYSPNGLTDPAQVDLERRIEVTIDPFMEGRGARLVVRTAKEENLLEVTSVLGDPDHPMDRAQVAAKARAFLNLAVGETKAERLIQFLLAADLDTPFSLDP